MPHTSDTYFPTDAGQELALLSFGAAIASALAVRAGSKRAWQKAFGSEPPLNPAADEVSWKEALIWGGCVG
ncbi:MAG: DUF4235 domain-containing protein, partial [Bdellovibrionales bacterium]|nr:DUF4235 domain-containing protein [Bdellovibrionales bacterium]